MMGVQLDTQKAAPELVEAQLAAVRIILTDPMKIYEVPRLKGLHFSDLRLGRMMDAVHALNDADKKIDTITLVKQLRETGELENAGGPSAVTAVLTKTHGTDLKECERIILSEWQRKEGMRIANEMARAISNPEATPFETFNLVSADIDMVTNYVTAADEQTTADKVDDFLAHIAKPGSENTFSTFDIPAFDDKADIQPGSVIVISGSPGSGKSSLFNCAMATALNHGRPIYVKSGENGVRAQLNRLLSADSGIPAKDIKKNKLTPDDRVKLEFSAQRIRESGVIVEAGSMTGEEVISKIRYLHATKGITEFWFDRVELINVSAFDKDSEAGRGKFMERIRTLAVDLDIRIFIACQLRKSYENRARCEPELVDLKGTSAIGDSATHVILLTRPEYHGIEDMEDGSSSAGLGKLMLVKNTEGEPGDFICRFNAICTTWEPLDKDEHAKWNGDGIDRTSQEPVKESYGTHGQIRAASLASKMNTDEDIPF